MRFKLLFAAFGAAFLLTGCVIKPIEEGSTAIQTEPGTAAPDETTAAEEAVTTTGETTITTSDTTEETTGATTAKRPDPPADLVLKGLENVEAGADLTVADFITERNVGLKDGDAWLDTTKTGECTAEVTYLYGGAEFTQKLHYRVADTTAPHIFDPGRGAVHRLGKAFDLNAYIGYGDNFDPKPVMSYTGEVDPETEGSYPLTVTVTDQAGNAVSWDVTIRVAAEVPKPADTIRRVNYSDFISRYKGDGVTFGIDVSAWQGDVDYKAVREAGCSFVIMRVGHYYSKVKLDDYFQKNLKNAAAAGLQVGVYFYTTDRNEKDVREHVRWITEQLGGQKLDLPIVFDWEEFSDFEEYGISIRELNDVYAAFADEVRKQGYQPMLYGSKNVLNEVWSARSKQLAPVWLAHYVRETTYTGAYEIWQQSAYGRIPGVSGDVDMDIRYLKKEAD